MLQIRSQHEKWIFCPFREQRMKNTIDELRRSLVIKAALSFHADGGACSSLVHIKAFQSGESEPQEYGSGFDFLLLERSTRTMYYLF